MAGRPTQGCRLLLVSKLLLASWVAAFAFARNDRCQFLVCVFILARPLSVSAGNEEETEEGGEFSYRAPDVRENVRHPTSNFRFLNWLS